MADAQNSGKISITQLRRYVLLFAFLILSFGAGYRFAIWRVSDRGIDGPVQSFLRAPEEGSVDGADFQKYWDVWRRLEKSYVDTEKIDYREMTWGSMKGLAQSLGDPYTTYLPPEDNKRSLENLNGAFFGVGIELGYVDGSLAVVSPLEGGPAIRQGVRAGDLILHIRDDSKGIDVDTTGMSLIDAVTNIRGEKGVPVTLTLYREGDDGPFEVVINREEIVIPSLELTYVQRDGLNIAHLQLYRFGGRTDNEWLEAVGEIVANKVDGVILDLRNNPGGYLDGSVFVASEFLSEGLVVTQQGRYETENFSVDRRGSLTNVPLVVLVNKGSASASEITAGAIRDHERAKLVGETTFGKGTVQEVQDLGDGSSLHVTVAKWLLPLGDWIGDGGVAPDVEAVDDPETEDIDEQLEAAVSTLLDEIL